MLEQYSWAFYRERRLTLSIIPHEHPQLHFFQHHYFDLPLLFILPFISAITQYHLDNDERISRHRPDVLFHPPLQAAAWVSHCFTERSLVSEDLWLSMQHAVVSFSLKLELFCEIRHLFIFARARGARRIASDSVGRTPVYGPCLAET